MHLVTTLCIVVSASVFCQGAVLSKRQDDSNIAVSCNSAKIDLQLGSATTNGYNNQESSLHHAQQLYKASQRYLKVASIYKNNTGNSLSWLDGLQTDHFHQMGKYLSLNQPTTPSDVDREMWGEIALGSEKHVTTFEFNLISGDIGVLGHGTTFDAYNPYTSSSARDTHRIMFYTYYQSLDSHSVTPMYVWQDQFAVGGINVIGQSFGITFIDSIPWNILGLNFKESSSSRRPNLVNNMYTQGLISQNVFSLNRKEKTLEIGCIDYNAFDGDLAYSPVPTPSFWNIINFNIQFSSQNLSIPILTSMIVDSEVNGIYIPVAAAYKFYSVFSDKKVSYKNHVVTWSLPCDVNIDGLVFGFGNNSIAVTPEMLLGSPSDDGNYCTSNIVGSSLGFGILGTSFLDSVYTVFDYTMMQIGFAPAY